MGAFRRTSEAQASATLRQCGRASAPTTGGAIVVMPTPPSPGRGNDGLGCARIFTGAAAPGDMLVGSHQP